MVNDATLVPPKLMDFVLRRLMPLITTFPPAIPTVGENELITGGSIIFIVTGVLLSHADK